jgi:hypothetical protein
VGNLGSGERRIVREIEAQALRRNQRAGLTDMFSGEIAQLAVQQVGGGVVSHGVTPTQSVYCGDDAVTFAR